jgi:dTDP-glucose 4,6-dehydratase
MSKNVLITGGAGFIAHHVVDRILGETDWNIVSLDRLDFSGNLNRLHDVVSEYDAADQKRVRVIHHDLRAEINPLLRNQIGPVDIILHMAAGSHVDRSIQYPMDFVMDNVVGTCNILEFARQQDNLEQFVYFSTDEVFGPAHLGIAYDEYDRYNAGNPYSATKAGGEELAVCYENTYKMPIIITHTMNVFGQRQHPEKYIPICIRKVRDGETISIHSDATRTIPGSRFYIHASDVADGLMHLLDKQVHQIPHVHMGAKVCPKYNLVGKQEINNLELAQLIADAQGSELKYELVDFHSSRPGHDLRYALSGDRMRQIGWEPRVSLTERIHEVVDWTLNRPDWLEWK